MASSAIRSAGITDEACADREPYLPLSAQGSVVSAQIEERLAFVNFQAFHLADKNRVVTGGMLGDDVASQVRERIP